MMLIKMGWVPVNHKTNEVLWSMFTEEEEKVELVHPDWHWHVVKIERGAHNYGTSK
jgi:hypothetical protein